MNDALCTTQFVNAGGCALDWGMPDALHQDKVFDVSRELFSSQLNEDTSLMQIWILEKLNVLFRDNLLIVKCFSWVSDQFP